MFFDSGKECSAYLPQTSIFSSIQCVVRALFTFQYSSDWLLDGPGSFNLIVNYQKASDFYYPGHSGFLMMSTPEFIQMRWILVAFINLLFMLYTAKMSTINRGHYTSGESLVDSDIAIGWIIMRKNSQKGGTDKVAGLRLV